MKMTCLEIKEYINNSVSNLFSCQLENRLLVITTPFSYPDGDDIELFVELGDDSFILSDMGETLRYLDTYLLDINSSNKRKEIFYDVIRSNNLRFKKGVIYAVINNPDKILDAIFNMSQAIVRISDLLYTAKSRSLASFEEEVKNFFDDHQINYEENYPVKTPTNQYTFEFAVEKQEGISLIKLLNPPKKATQKPSIERMIQIWYDVSVNLSDEYPKENRITLLDDSYYHWEPRHYSLVENLSIVNK